MLHEDASPRLATLAVAARHCRLCRDTPLKAPLPHEPRPILRVSTEARVLIASQAPGLRAHASGIPFDDASGKRLRDWMALDPARFHDPDRVMIVPMGFCFPGYDPAGGDLPPRPECRLAWHDQIFAALPQVELILAIGLHAMRYHLPRLGIPVPAGAGMGELVARWGQLGGTQPRLIPLPHPSWRNTAWLKRNPWFAAELLPVLRAEVARLVP
jgi:uracil-DNA glycosylase